MFENWGATTSEISRRLPGDELITTPAFSATRAITIEAPATEVFPWIAQMGLGRAG